MERLIPIILLLAGLFTIICTYKEYPFFMQHRKAQIMIRVIGVGGTKFFYYTLGFALAVVGAFFLVHGVPQS